METKIKNDDQGQTIIQMRKVEGKMKNLQGEN